MDPLWSDILFVLLLFLVSVIFGTIGFYIFVDVSLANAFFNAGRVISGFDVIDENEPTTTSGKFFISAFKIYSGAFFLIVIAAIVSRAFNRGQQKDRPCCSHCSHRFTVPPEINIPLKDVGSKDPPTT